jgi:LysM repeat protein
MKLRSVFFSAAITTGQVEHVVVQPGDTLWAIARRAQPEGDLRPLVDELTRSRGNRPLQVGEEIAIPVGE